MRFGEQEIRPRDIFLIIWCGFSLIFPGYYLFDLENGIYAWAIVSAILSAYVVGSHLVAEAAERKNQNYSIFLIVGILISPLLMGIIVTLMGNPNKKKTKQR